MRIFNTFDFAEGEKDKIFILLTKFNEYFNPKRNLTYERHKFLTAKQLEGQTIEQYITSLKNLSLSCELEQLRESLVKDILICGIKSDHLREKLLQSDCEKLDDAIKICITSESVREKNKIISNGSSKGYSSAEQGVDQVKRSTPNKNGFNGHTKTSYSNFNNFKSNNKHKLQCQKCSYRHIKGKCPAYGKVCTRCQGYNHFSSCCRSSKNKNFKKPVYTIDNNSDMSVASNFIFLDKINAVDGQSTHRNTKTLFANRKGVASGLVWCHTFLSVCSVLKTFYGRNRS
ncbi:uncharacterized protein [Leptinotarsa decemlineata]|uniref:uncharacterized protein n=1 Tax=Leptinotarsa decemlineata TaxID=7539 RepID=UPI003D30A199